MPNYRSPSLCAANAKPLLANHEVSALSLENQHRLDPFHLYSFRQLHGGRTRNPMTARVAERRWFDGAAACGVRRVYPSV